MNSYDFYLLKLQCQVRGTTSFLPCSAVCDYPLCNKLNQLNLGVFFHESQGTLKDLAFRYFDNSFKVKIKLYYILCLHTENCNPLMFIILLSYNSICHGHIKHFSDLVNYIILCRSLCHLIQSHVLTHVCSTCVSIINCYLNYFSLGYKM